MTQLRPGQYHESLTEARIVDANERQLFGTDNPGFCIACGAESDQCEPDASEYTCHECNQRKVYGAAELLFLLSWE